MPTPRTLYFSRDSRDAVPELYVDGTTATVLRLPSAVDPERTKLLGWEGRFEPLLAGGRSVVIAPLQNLARGDRFMLLVTLLDGTEIPLTVTAATCRIDGQISVFPDPEAPAALRKALDEKTQEVDSLRAENNQRREQETSVDHALAALLARDQVALTPFSESRKWRLREESADVEVSLFLPKGKKVAASKAAVVFTVKNRDPARSRALQEARLTTYATRQAHPFALRATLPSIAPGEEGRIAIVTDFDSFDPARDGDRLVLELFRGDGLRQAYVELMPQSQR
ncbi:DUF2381 family protein [Pyxidicoccus fallax]|uniref:DUF2381 family protein n=2 Tax=Pyxidicoccus fallax TaxID=394095 RepID=A0A848LI66_9BACT|nr:DUF2381 family protein [Pyxidicoccus fallax]NPC77962.1 DUF2381 family protein [Pyxidicoccus fallax]